MSFTTCKFTDVEVSQARVQYSTCFNITFPMTVNMLVHNLPPIEIYGGEAGDHPTGREGQGVCT